MNRYQSDSCSTVWNPHQSNMIDKIEMVQRRAARFVTHNYGRQESPTEMIKALGWHTLEERRARQSLVMFFKIVTNRIAINKDLLTQEITGRTRRNHDLTYCHQQCQVEAYRQSFFPSTIPQMERSASLRSVSSQCGRIQGTTTKIHLVNVHYSF